MINLVFLFGFTLHLQKQTFSLHFFGGEAIGTSTSLTLTHNYSYNETFSAVEEPVLHRLLNSIL